MERTFRKTAADSSTTDGSRPKRTTWPEDSELTWDQVLASPRVLMVAEAGAGKTHECRACAKALFEKGEAAFFVRLESVAKNGVAVALRGPLRERFNKWRKSAGQIAYFFLDSIDELQLSHFTFRDALERLTVSAWLTCDDANKLVSVRSALDSFGDRQKFGERAPVDRHRARRDHDGRLAENALKIFCDRRNARVPWRPSSTATARASGVGSKCRRSSLPGWPNSALGTRSCDSGRLGSRTLKSASSCWSWSRSGSIRSARTSRYQLPRTRRQATLSASRH